MISNKKSEILHFASELLHNPRSFLRAVLIIVAYLLAFVILDLITKQFEVLPGIVAWYPPAGLTYTLLLVFGVRFTPAVTIVLFLSSVFIYHLPQPNFLLFLWAVIISLIYGATAAFLRRRIHFDWQLRKLRDVVWFVFTTVLVSAILAILSVSSSAVSSKMPQNDIFRTIFDWWIGETVGVLTVTPFMLIYVIPTLKRFTTRKQGRVPAGWSFPRPTLSDIVQVSSLAFSLYWVFGGPVQQEFRPLYLITLPLIWIALQRGLKGVSAAILLINTGVVLAVWLFQFGSARLSELELLMIIICVVGLLMGAVVTERNQSGKSLRDNEIRFRALIENSSDAIILINSEGKTTYRTPAVNRLNGWYSAVLPENSLFSTTIHPDDLNNSLKHFAQLLQTPDKSVLFQFRVQHSDGLWRWMEGTGTNLLTVPAVNAIVVNYRDVTERKQDEEEIKNRNNELSMLFNLSQSLAVADNLDDILNLVNRYAVESVNTTFARIAFIEDGNFIIRAGYPIRPLEHDLRLGERNPAAALPFALRILEQNKPMILRASDAGISNEEKKALLLDFAKTLCIIPLQISESSPTSLKYLGFIMLGEARSEGREPFTPEKMRLAQTISASAAIAIRRMLLHEQTERRLQQLVALSEIDLAIISSSDMVFSLGVLLLQAKEQLKVDAACVWLFNPTLQVLEFVTGRGFRTPAFENAKPLHLGEGNAGRAALERQTIHVPNLTTHNNHPRLIKAEPFISYYAVPLIVKNQLKGVLELFHRTELESNEEWLNFLHSLAYQAAIAIDNSSLFNDLMHSNTELTQAYDATIQGWSHALDLRDKETEGHTMRVTEMAERFARALGIDEAEIVHIRRGALLHDIGKMGVPDGILLKPEKLTDEEWEIMIKHPQFAYDMLVPIAYLKPALDIPYCHHEKWDGSGYPRGLKGKQIPRAARLFAIVDVWDALTSDRPYRKGWTKKKTVEHIKAGSGTHFDPKLVELFLSVVSEKTYKH